MAQLAVTATSQQSRFHAETQESTSKDVDLKGVVLTVAHQELLSNAHLKLFSGEQSSCKSQHVVIKHFNACKIDNFDINLP